MPDDLTKESPKDMELPVSKYQKWYKEWEQSSSEWIKEAEEDCKFYHGGKGQWTEKDVSTLEAEGRPVLSINRIKPTIDLQKGIEIRSRTDIEAKPKKEQFSQTAVAITAGFKYIEDQNLVDQSISNVFFDGLKAGIGWIEICENDDPTEEEIQVRHIPWKEVGYDPHARDFLLDDARYIFKERWIDYDVAKQLWPKKAEELMMESKDTTQGQPYVEVPANERYGADRTGWNDTARQRIKLVQMFFKKPEMTGFLKMRDGEVVEINPEEIRRNPAIIANPSILKILQRPVLRVYEVIFSGETILEPERRSRYAHNRYPLIPFICYMDEEGKPYGLIRNMKDPQREINKNRSQYSHIITTRRVFWESGAFKNALEAKREIARPDAWIELNPGVMQNKRFEFQQDVQVAAEHFKIMQEAKQELQEVSGAVEEQMGQQTNARTGVAIEARQRQGATVNTEPFDNLRITKMRLGEMMLSMMKQYWNYEKVIRITDEKTGVDMWFTFNQNGTNDLTQGRYDIKVSEHPETETTRQWVSSRLMDFSTRMPPEVAIEVLMVAFEMSDVPNKEKVLERLKLAQNKVDILSQQRAHIDSMKKLSPPTSGAQEGSPSQA